MIIRPHTLTALALVAVATATSCSDVTSGQATACANNSDCLPGQWCDVDSQLCAGEPNADAFGDSSGAQCTLTQDCWPQEDGDLCNGFLMCRDGACVPDPGTVVVCPPSPPCQPNVCNPRTGSCGATVLPGCTSDACTSDEECPVLTACEVPSCIDGYCLREPRNCLDDDPCTDDYCDSGGCQHVINPQRAGCSNPPPPPGACEFAWQCPAAGAPPGADGDAVCAYSDCVDGECVTLPTQGIEICSDGQDNDCDGLVDCADDNCVDALACGTCATNPIALQCNKWTSVQGLWSGAGITKYACHSGTFEGSEIAFSFELAYDATIRLTGLIKPSEATWMMTLAGDCSGDACTASVPIGTLEAGVSVAVEAGVPYYFAIDRSDGAAVYFAEIYVECPSQEYCQDFFDNDGDGLTDCADTDCDGVLPCQAFETNCVDGIDNDGDGATDCADDGCADAESCDDPPPQEMQCNDDFDNDADGLEDCKDPDCFDAPECLPSGTCEPLMAIGCGQSVWQSFESKSFDIAAYECAPGATFPGGELAFQFTPDSDVTMELSGSGEPKASQWFLLEGTCAGSSCVATSGAPVVELPLTAKVEGGTTYFIVMDSVQDAPTVSFGAYLACYGDEVCDDQFDNDGDGAVDCADNDCAGVGQCQAFETNCVDGIDNDGDGETDCQEQWCVDNTSWCEGQPPPECSVAGELECGGYWSEPTLASDDLLSTYSCVSGSFPGGETVLTFTAQQTGSVQIFGFAEPFEQVAFFLLEAACDGDACIASSPDFFTPLEAEVEAGTTYFVVIDAAVPSDVFVFDVNMTCLGPEDCSDGLDNDNDGKVDCADSECVDAGPPCQPFETNCIDGVDNDGDGATDCAEVWCKANLPECGFTEDCSDGIDNDGDGHEDCADAECVGDPACPAQACSSEQYALACNEPATDLFLSGSGSIDTYSCSDEQLPGGEWVFSLGSGLSGPVVWEGTSDAGAGARALLMVGECASTACQQMTPADFEGQLSLAWEADPALDYWIVVDNAAPWEAVVWQTTLSCL